MTQTIDWPRIELVLEKWVRGLHWNEYGTRLPKDTSFRVAMVATTQAKTVIPMTYPSKGSWPGTFEYWHERESADPLRTRWVFLVWNVMGFIAVTNQDLAVVTGDVFDV